MQKICIFIKKKLEKRLTIIVFCAIIITRNNVTRIKEHSSEISFRDEMYRGIKNQDWGILNVKFLMARVGMGILHVMGICVKGDGFSEEPQLGNCVRGHSKVKGKSVKGNS